MILMPVTWFWVCIVLGILCERDFQRGWKPDETVQPPEWVLVVFIALFWPMAVGRLLQRAFENAGKP